MTTQTTIKVSTETRDQLKRAARAQQCTIDQYLNKLIAIADREQRWDSLRASVAKMTAQDWAEYMAEADPYVRDDDWDGVTVDPEWQDEWNAHLARQAALGAAAGAVDGKNA